MTARRDAVTIFLCSSPLQLIHAHLVRNNHIRESHEECFLFYEGPVAQQLIVQSMWSGVRELASSRRVAGAAQKNIRENLQTIIAQVPWKDYNSVHLVISDLYWLMNNVAVATLSKNCAKKERKFSLSILDEGLIVYTGGKLGWKRSLRCLGRSSYLFAGGLNTVLIHNSNADYRHPACQAVYCLHPSMLQVPRNVKKVAIDPDMLCEVYKNRFGSLQLKPRSALYLSQPIYQKLGEKRHLELVRACRESLKRQGIKNFYYKPHHFDNDRWRKIVESGLGFEPVPNGHGLPVEVWAKSCNAEIIFGHFSSALLNLHAYGYQGRVMACGLKQVRSIFHENKQFLEYLDVLERIGTVETLDLMEPQISAALATGCNP